MFSRGIDPKFAFTRKAVRPSLFFAMLLLAAYLRITGLTWGLTTGYGHFRNFHPDEFLSLRGVLQVDLLRGRIKAPAAYFEGTFNYYLWAIPQAALNLSSNTGLTSTASKKMETEGHASLLYICRWMSVLFDLSVVVVVFLAIREVTRNFYPSLLGAFVYAILPMQVIYAHFMRTHLLANLLWAMVIWLSLKFRKRQRWWMIFIVGCISGLGAATHYPVGIIVIVPCFYFLFQRFDNLSNWRIRFWKRVKCFVAGPVWLIALGFLLGLFIGQPELFFDSRAVANEITNYMSRYASLHEFKASSLLNLSTVWESVSFLIPYSMYPILWLLPYCAVCYLCFRRRLYSKSLPILLVSLLYLYFMSKGYVVPIFARAMMLLFPGLCILIGLAFDDLLLLWRKRPIIVTLLTGALLPFVMPSIVFDLAYVRAMRQKDPRSALREDLEKLIGDATVTVGVFKFGGYFYTVMPAVEPLKSQRVTVQLQDPGQKADIFLAGFPVPINPAWSGTIISEVERQGRFRYEKSYVVRPRVLGRELQLARFPSDMTYPFPTILLFRAKTQT